MCPMIKFFFPIFRNEEIFGLFFSARYVMYLNTKYVV